MAVFEWEGRSLNGELKKGTLGAESESELRAMIRRDGVILTKAIAKSKVATKGKVGRSKKIKPVQVAIFTRQLSTMINSGLPLVQSLDILSGQLESAPLRAITRAMKEKIEGGARFAEALRDYPNCFDDLYVSLVVAGEEGGMLDSILVRLSNYMEKTERLKKKVKSALIYPSSIVVVAIGVVLVLLLFVIPVFERMFAGIGKTLPIPTQIVIGLSAFVKAGIFYIAATVAAGTIGLKKYYGTDNGRRTIDRLVLKIPVIGLLL